MNMKYFPLVVLSRTTRPMFAVAVVLDDLQRDEGQ